MATDAQVEAGDEPGEALAADGATVEAGDLPVDGPPMPDPETVPPPPAEPVAPAGRLASVDVLRGVALLGILAMNIVDFAWPNRVYSNPYAAPGAGPVDVGFWMFNHFVFDTKMMTLFSMLFGAGLVLMTDRAEGRGARLGRVYYRRVSWLLVIGLIHSYLIWAGDILVMYASCGFLLYPCRRWSPKTLLVVGTCLVLMAAPLVVGARGAFSYMKRTHERVQAETKAGKTPTKWEKRVSDGWAKTLKGTKPSHERFQKDIATHRGGYAGIVKERAEELISSQTFGFIFAGWWLAGGRMLLGMGLMKLGVFSGLRSNRFYTWMMVLGYGIGLPLMAIETAVSLRTGFFAGRPLDYITQGWVLLYLVGSMPVVLGHVGLVMLIVRAGLLSGLTRRLAAVGRMALSNYLFDSILCTTLFYGYGLGLYGSVPRPYLMGLTLMIWAFQLTFSPVWLAHFRYGPAEWLWRSLTYWKPQPMRAVAG
ncbi:DUF418 domain-containing protein [Isosphaeraceae bacterium EP7]